MACHPKLSAQREAKDGGGGGSRTRCPSYLYQLFHIVSIADLQQAYNHSAPPSPAGAQAEAGEGGATIASASWQKIFNLLT
jgi:hypothetical protein